MTLSFQEVRLIGCAEVPLRGLVVRGADHYKHEI